MDSNFDSRIIICTNLFYIRNNIVLSLIQVATRRLFCYNHPRSMHNLETFKNEMKKAEEWLLKEYSQIHSGRATPMLIDGVQVESYGAFQPIKNVASISIEDPKTLRVSPWDKGQNKEIERALHSANLGFSIVVDDNGVRVIVPSLTEETRNNLIKLAKEKMEDARITIRKARENELGILKEKSLPEDIEKRTKEEIQKIVDGGNAVLEKCFVNKESDILS